MEKRLEKLINHRKNPTLKGYFLDENLDKDNITPKVKKF